MIEIPKATEPHGVYKSTFLYSVDVKLRFSTPLSDYYDQLKQFFGEVFGLTLDRVQYDDMEFHPIKLFAEQGARVIKIQSGFFQFKIMHDQYYTFSETVMPVISEFLKFLQTVDAQVSTFSIRKMNIWPFTGREDKGIELFPDIFSRELMENMHLKFSSDEMVASEERQLDMPEQGDVTFIRAGMILNEGDGASKLILDTETVYNGGPVSVTDSSLIPDKLTKMNDYLFDIYHWAVTDEVIDKMKEEAKS